MELEQIIDIVKEASTLMVRGGFRVMQKESRENLVTSSDLAVQHFLVDKLEKLLPGSGFLCEEEDFRELTHEYIWIIDPIDGTANYARGIADCCISVALVRGGQLYMGVVYSPWRQELYCAEKGKGAFCNGHPIQVSGRPFEDGLFCTAMSTYRKAYAKTCSDIIYDIYMQCNDTRRFGSAAVELCMMAAGIIELYFEMRLQPWDYAAATLILQEAGGHICNFEGRMPSLNKASFILAANNQQNCSRMLDIVHKHMEALPY
ncbi:MAG: inositol monophosphatase [Bacteroidales bacterium]|nr:inositol monophosphatase [Bacteroidales bacterium]